jgi:hypothetical protein
LLSIEKMEGMREGMREGKKRKKGLEPMVTAVALGLPDVL